MKKKRNWRTTARMYDLKYMRDISLAKPYWPNTPIPIKKRKIRKLGRRKAE